MLFLVIYRLKIFSEESVPLFGPPLPSPPVFTDHQEFRDFLLVKCEERNDQGCDGLVSSVQEVFFLIFCSNQWRKSHTGDTDICPEASADPWHADPLALPRPHAWPAQGLAAFSCFLWKFHCLLLTDRSHSHCCTAFFHCSPQFASAYCTMTWYYCNADFLSHPPSSHRFCSFF